MKTFLGGSCDTAAEVEVPEPSQPSQPSQSTEPPEPSVFDTPFSTRSNPAVTATTTHVTNRYITNPTTIIRETVHVPVNTNTNTNTFDTSEFITKDAFYSQIDNLVDGSSENLGNLSSSFNTQTLTVSGGTTLDTLTAATSTLAKLTVTGDASIGGTLSAGTLSVTSLSSAAAIVAPYFSATNTAATSTFAGGLNIGSGGLVYDLNTGNVGIGTTSPAEKLEVTGNIFLPPSANGATSTSPAFGFPEELADQGVIYIESGLELAGLTREYDMRIHNYTNCIRSGTCSYGGNVFAGVAAGNFRNSGASNVGVGDLALRDLTTGWQNVAVGSFSLPDLTTGDFNTSIGNQALSLLVTGDGNVAIGSGALDDQSSGDNNVGVGRRALANNTTGAGNVAVGFQALRNGVTASSTAIGYNAGGNGNGTSDSNVFVGYNAASAISTGSNNLIAGYHAGDNLTTGSNNIILGYDIDAQSATQSNRLNIGNLIFGTGIDGTGTTLSSGNVGIGTSTPAYTLSVNGTAAFTGLTNDGSGYYACVDTTTGELSTSTTACGASSERFKTNIEDLTYGLETINQLRPVSFDWKEDFIAHGTPQIGLIAEEVASTVPEVIGYDNDGRITNLDYPKLVAVLINAMKELSQKITDIKNKITGFEEQFTTRELCLEDEEGNTTCITKNQLDDLLEGGDVPTGGNQNSKNSEDGEDQEDQNDTSASTEGSGVTQQDTSDEQEDGADQTDSEDTSEESDDTADASSEDTGDSEDRSAETKPDTTGQDAEDVNDDTEDGSESDSDGAESDESSDDDSDSDADAGGDSGDGSDDDSGDGV